MTEALPKRINEHRVPNRRVERVSHGSHPMCTSKDFNCRRKAFNAQFFQLKGHNSKRYGEYPKGRGEREEGNEREGP